MISTATRKKRVAAALALAGTLILAGCGSDNGNKISGTKGGIYNGGCVPISTNQIPFRITNGVVLGGQIQAGGSYGGTVQLGAGGSIAGGFQDVGVDGSTLSLNILPNAGGTSLTGSGSVSATGYFRLSELHVSYLRSQLALLNPNYNNPNYNGAYPNGNYPTAYNSQGCISEIAVQTTLYGTSLRYTTLWLKVNGGALSYPVTM